MRPLVDMQYRYYVKIIIRMEGNEASKTIKFVKGNSRDVKVKRQTFKATGGMMSLPNNFERRGS